MNKSRRAELKSIITLIEDAKDRLETVLSEEEESKDGTPESLQYTERYEQSEAACERLTEAVDSLDDAIDAVNQAIV